MKRLLPIVLVAALGFAAGWVAAGGSAGRRPAQFPPGAELVVERPTGEVVTGAAGTGDPQPRFERVTLRVVKVRGEAAGTPPGAVPWRLTVGGATYVAVPD